VIICEIRGLEKMKSKTALAIGAHPDDVEIFAAGTLALLYEKGWNIVIATMTAGDLGSVVHDRKEISKIRKKEATQAARLLDAEYFCLENDDVFILYDRPTILKTIILVREVQPDIVLTMSPQDYMVDHEITSKLVRTACFSATMFQLKTVKEEPLERIPFLYYFDSMDGINILGEEIKPSIYVDISPVMTLKTDMLKCHKSQRKWLRKQHGVDDYILSMQTFSGRRGNEIGAQYAEGFRQHLGHAFPQENILKKELHLLVREI